MKSSSLFFLLLYVFLFSCRPALPVPAPLQECSDCDSGSRLSFEKAGLHSHQTGVMLYDPQRNAVLLSHNAENFYIPASTTKVLTALAVLERLGGQYRFITRLRATGVVKDGVLNGSLYLQGSGDPSLDVAELHDMVLTLKARGVERLRGKFYYDESLFIPASSIEESMEQNSGDNPGVGALSLHRNLLRVRWDFSRSPKRLELVPRVDGITVEESSFHGPWKSRYSLRGGVHTWQIRESVAMEEMELPVKDSGAYTAAIFRQLCRQHGIMLPEPATAKVPWYARDVAVCQSIPLWQIVETMLTESSCVMAEQLLLSAASKDMEQPDLRQAAAWLREFWMMELSLGKEPVLVNGSGLTTENRITPRQYMEVLRYSYGKRYGERSFLSMLPVSGWRGTLDRRLTDEDTALRVWAKTGTLYYATALAGVLHASSGRELLFVIFVNDPLERMLFDNSLDGNSEESRIRASQWLVRQKRGIDEMIRYWIETY